MKLQVISLPAIYLMDAHGDGFFNGAIRRGLAAVGKDGQRHVVDAIMSSSPRAPVDTGLLRNSISYRVHADGLSVDIGPAPPATERAAVMELGRRPGARMPPIDPIFQWVHRKGIATRFLMGRKRQLARERSLTRKVSRGGKKLSVGKKAILRDVELDLAFAIQRSIKKKGIAPRRFMRRAEPIVRRNAPWLINIAITNAIRAAKGGVREV